MPEFKDLKAYRDTTRRLQKGGGYVPSPEPSTKVTIILVIVVAFICFISLARY